MKFTDKIINKLTGRNMESIELNFEQFLALLDKEFLSKATTTDDYEQIFKTIKGSWFGIRKLQSKDGRYELMAQTHARVGIFNMKDHNRWHIHDEVEDKYFEYRRYFLGPMKRAVKTRIAAYKSGIV